MRRECFWTKATLILPLALVLGSAVLACGQELSQGTRDREATGKNGMVASAHPLASLAAVEILRKGGNAVDAAVAAAFVIGVVEPDGSGLGGGGGMLIRFAEQQKPVYINYYPRASSEISTVSYTPRTDAQTGKAILVPGTASGLTLALEKFGTLDLSTVLESAIRYAENGFLVDETLAKVLLDNLPVVQQHPSTAAVYLRDGFPLMEGDTLRQPELAQTLRLIAGKGRAGFYEGPVAEALVEATTKSGGALTRGDLRAYRAEIVQPLQGTYRDIEVLSAPPPHSGAFVQEALNILEYEDIRKLGHYASSAATMHLFAETLRRVYADRTAFLADPLFEQVPLDGLVNKEYARKRFEDINRNVAEPREYRKTKAGDPAPFAREVPAKPPPAPLVPQGPGRRRNDNDSDGGGHTTHLCVFDSVGNTVSLTQTLGTFFGSGVTAAGVLLNNARSNFSYLTERNAAGPGKQPRSSISPTILLKDGKTFAALGSPGATRIVATVVQLVVNIVDYGMTAPMANRAPRFLCQKSDEYLHLESRITPEVQEELKRRGHSLRVYGDFDLFFGGAQLIVIDPATGTLHGSADPRRGGAAIGY